MEEIKIKAFRHGLARYTQGKLDSLRDADDLTFEGKKIVAKTAENLVSVVDPKSKFLFISSPFGRCLNTVNIVRQIFYAHSIHDIYIEIAEELEEVKNFDWQLFEPLILGGEQCIFNEKFFIDKKVTNPQDLYYPDYFMYRSFNEINFSLLSECPEEYVKKIKKFESFLSVAGRLIVFLLNLRKQVQNDFDEIFIFTHDGLLLLPNFLINHKTGSVSPGTFIDLFLNEDGLFIREKRIGKMVNVVDAYDIWPF